MLVGIFMRFTIRDLLWLTVAVAAFCTGTQLDRYWEQHRADPRDASIRAALDQKTDIKFVETPLGGVIDDLKQRHPIAIQWDHRALTVSSIPFDTPVPPPTPAYPHSTPSYPTLHNHTSP